MKTKQCGKCKKHKVLTEFNRSVAGKYGRRSKCRECDNAYCREYRKSERVKERIRAYNKNYNVKNREKYKRELEELEID